MQIELDRKKLYCKKGEEKKQNKMKAEEVNTDYTLVLFS